MTVVSGTVIPQTYLVEIVEAQGLCDCVDEYGIWDGVGDDIGEVDLEEEGISDYGAAVDVSDLD